MGYIDRKKHDADVMERVLGVDNDASPHTEVINLGVRPWVMGMVASGVQLSIGDGYLRPNQSSTARRRGPADH